MKPQRKRAKQACVTCNVRRVKCNVIESVPCRNCAVAGVPCEVRESRRGKHPRRRSVASSDAGQRKARSVERNTTSDEVTATHVLASLSQNHSGTARQEESASETTDQVEPEDAERNDDEGAVFLGESTSIRYVNIDQPTNPRARHETRDGRRLLHAVPKGAKATSLIPKWEAERKRRRVESLKAEGCFSSPDPAAVEILFGAYFRWFHPCFPIVDELDIRTQHSKGSLSSLLLQAILFVGVIHCEDEDLVQAGISNRQEAKYLFYNRAKDIYDADFEARTLSITQALFLMSFWRAGALLEKDARHWLGAAISLAQTKAMHRCGTKEDTRNYKLRKRVWWAIYIRERQCAAALGLPNRIRDEDCDVHTLEADDFEDAFNTSFTVAQRQACISYMISIAELSQVLGEIVHCGYLPGRSLSVQDRLRFKTELMTWKQTLPSTMKVDEDFGDQLGFLSNMLHLAYNNLFILLFRNSFIASTEYQPNEEGKIALQAAGRNARIIEDMLSEGNLRHAQIHVITNLFNTLCIHTINLKRASGTSRTIAEHRAKICLLGLQEVQRTWEVTNWVLQLFFKYLDSSTAARLQVNDPEPAIPTNQTANPYQGVGGMHPYLVPVEGSAFPNHHPHQNHNYHDIGMNKPVLTDTPWSWSTEEANEILFSHIENDFAFGEGGCQITDPDSDDTFGNMFSQLGSSVPSVLTQ